MAIRFKNGLSSETVLPITSEDDFDACLLFRYTLYELITGIKCVSATEGLGHVPGRDEADSSEYTRAGESSEEVTAFSYSGYAFNVAHEPFDVRLWPSRIRALDDSLLICEKDQPIVRELVLKILVLVGRCFLDYKSKMLV